MIIRFVKLEINPDRIEDFKKLTANEQADILAFPGCSHLKVFQDINHPTTFFTQSHWESEDALNHYRDSDFFQGNWKTVKQWFIAKPQAWSLDKVHD